MRSRCLTAALAVVASLPAVSDASTRSRRDASARAARDGCQTKACRERVLMREYRQHPMPWCTWAPESNWDPRTGVSFIGRPWAIGRYRVVNPSSGTGGKFQFQPTTWWSIGGHGLPQDAQPVDQERLARRLRAMMGLSPWVNC